jgi:hypothetical protein
LADVAAADRAVRALESMHDRNPEFLDRDDLAPIFTTCGASASVPLQELTRRDAA